ncbi:MAG TPA: hypothetical protein VKU00_01620 [Chthonomonadaceae bacterium]|nr:hypothetical protein [Chthonomonadaceae bacterium]
MAQTTLTRVLEEIKTLAPEELRMVELAVQSQLNRPANDSASPSNAWDVLEELIGTVDAPADWSEEHDHYLSGAPRRRPGDLA